MKTLYICVLLTVCSAVPLFAQEPEQSSKSYEAFVAPLVEVLGYGLNAPAFGGGFALGAGKGSAIGIRLLYAITEEQVSSFELAFFLRFYILGTQADSGPFAQFTAGFALFAVDDAISIPAQAGAFSAGATAGWRFLLGNRWYAEGTVRIGYPYILGIGASAGFRF